MTEQHPITPPAKLVARWMSSYCGYQDAAKWGADQELEACLQWFSAFYCMETWMQKDLEKFREARRPKPPSLKERALEILNARFDALPPIDANIIRQALEQLDD